MNTNVRVTLFCVCIPFSIVSMDVGELCRVDRTGDNGWCKIVTDCPQILNEIRHGKYPTSQCGFHEREQIICCPEIKPIATTTSHSSRISQKSENYTGTVTLRRRNCEMVSEEEEENSLNEEEMK